MTSTPDFEASDGDGFISELPLKRTWLDDIVDALLRRPEGTGDVKSISFHIMRSQRNVGSEPEATITRTINNYCGDANDIDRQVKFDLFERVAPGTYRLRGYPQKPNLIDIQNIEFIDSAYAGTWDWFCKKVERNPKWPALTKRQRLIAFSRSIQPGGGSCEELQCQIKWRNEIEQLSYESLI